MSKKIILAAAVSSVALFVGSAYAADADTAVVDDASTVVVFGTRAADRDSIAQQKKSNNLVNIITSNDAGKLPDQNVAEAVQRLPGVSMDDDQGEGRYVVIRGLDPALAAVRINGQEAAAPETESREVKLDTMPTGLIGGIEVIKDQTAEYDANAIAGAVNIKTLSAFDKKRKFLNLRFSEGKIDLTDKSSYDADISGGTTFGANKEFGVAFALNASRRPQGSHNIQGTDGWYESDKGNIVPDDWRLRDYYVIRNRQGAAINLDYRPSDNLQLYARTLYSHFTDLEQRQQFRVKLGDGKISNETAETADFSSTRAQRDAKYRDEDEKITTINLGGKYFIGKNRLDFDLTNSTAKKDDDPRYNFSYQTGKKAVSGSWDLAGDIFTVNPSDSAYDASEYTSKEFELEKDHYKEDLNQFRVDYTMPTNLWGGDTEFKMGLKYSDRHKQSEIFYRLYDVADMNLTDFTYGDAGTMYDGQYKFGPGVDFGKSLEYAEAHDLLELNKEDSLVGDLAGDYDVKEKVTAAYFQANIKNGNWTIIPGLRYEHTSSEFKAKQFDEDSDFDMGFNGIGSKNYNDFFPSVVGRYELADNQQIRFAVTTSIGRPNYVDLAPYAEISKSDEEISMGNPNLKPLRAVNFDAGYEYYMGKSGVASVQAFYKDIEDPIFSVLTREDITIGGNDYVNAKVTQPQNLSSAKVYGIELNYVNQFTALPAPFDGLGISLNATFQKSSTDSAPNRDDKTRLIYTSDFTGTAELTYEKDNLTARLAYSYRSKFLDTLGKSKDYDIYTDGRGKVDFKLGYAINDNMQVFVQGKNLNEAEWHRYMGVKNRLVENEFYGKTWALGFEAKF